MLQLECFIPAYNEAVDLERNVLTLVAFCEGAWRGQFRVTIVENGSTDRTGEVAVRLAGSRAEIGVVRVAEKGRGHALRQAFLASQARWLGYMDADLSTHLRALPEALQRLAAGADLVIGSRLIRGAHVRRRLYREALSRTYNGLIRTVFGSRIRDHQCGFKFLTRAVCSELVPCTYDRRWFFDTELLVLAERAGYRIDEIPVDWIEDLGSTVHVVRTVLDDLSGMWRLWRRVGRRGRA
jgi:glycosyltransferase involved in cell wall biosynthesis